MVCGNTTFETKAWIRCSSNFNGNKALLQTSFFDSNKIEVGASNPSFPTKCDNSWQEVKTSYDSKGKSICSFKVVVATDLKHTKGYVDITKISVRPQSLSSTADVQDLRTNAPVFSDTHTYRYAYVPSVLRQGKILPLPSISGDVGGEVFELH